MTVGKRSSRGLVGVSKKEPSIRLLASYEAVSTNAKVKELGIRFIKVTNRNCLIRINNLLRRNYTSWTSER